MFDSILLFTDGAARGNPGPAGWGSVVVTPEGRVTELGGGVRKATNNQMELAAVIEGLKFLETTTGDVAVYSDSVYVLKGITAWVHGWIKRGWRTASGGEVSNIGYWKRLSGLVRDRAELGRISWHYVQGHAGTPGNERCDQIATAFADGKPPRLYQGELLQYDVAVHDLPEDTSIPDRNSPAKRKPKGKPHCYLSLVGGKLERHASWAECEARVKGVRGARFKKAMTEAEAREIIAGWGL